MTQGDRAVRWGGEWMPRQEGDFVEGDRLCEDASGDVLEILSGGGGHSTDGTCERLEEGNGCAKTMDCEAVSSEWSNEGNFARGGCEFDQAERDYEWGEKAVDEWDFRCGLIVNGIESDSEKV